MKWLDLLVKLAAPIVALVKSIAGSDWDDDAAAEAFRDMLRNPPRQAVDDADRDLLRGIARGTTGSD